ncbi:MAG: error-prone DNA polymerase [Alphaproteobacteria bacterium]
MARYAELQVSTNFSFLRGASHPEELVEAAKALGHDAIAVTDRNTLAGAVRMHGAAKAAGLRLVPGVRLDLIDSTSILCYPIDRKSYGRLCRLLTLGQRRAEKGACALHLRDALDHAEGQIIAILPPDSPGDWLPGDRSLAERTLAEWKSAVGDRCYLVGHRLYQGDDNRRLATLADLAARHGVPLLATNDVHAHIPGRRALQDALACIRAGTTIERAGSLLFAHEERHLKAPGEMARLFRHHPDAIARTAEIGARTRFSFDDLRYEYPTETLAGETPQQTLERETLAGAHARYGGEIPPKVQAQIAYELRLIGTLGYAPYFLTVHDIVRFARERKILCQGRGSAANSAICYCLGITAVDPSRLDLLFERFVSAERNEPPDIDVDFEHERREEVIQYIYAKYGRERAGIAATVIRYRARSAIRDVGKALGLSEDMTGALAGTVWGWSGDAIRPEWLRETGFDPTDPRLGTAIDLARALIGFPRHLSQHVGGFVITRGPLEEVVPIGNAAMADRTFIEWDKDDLDMLGILKIDILALGMLTCIRKAFASIEAETGERLSLATLPAEDPAVYDMLCRADSIGVFQVESRAQMSFLPRMKPRNFYDLVIQVAIVRPGPIQGDMVHPYLRRRNGEELVELPSEELRQVLGKTLGVPLFQEQAMRIAIVAAGFTPPEADRLRRAMASFRKTGQIHIFRAKMIEGMTARGYDRAFAERCFRQIEGFGEYGFPESHAASFALLVYVSAWLKCRHPAAFACALLNSQPMGFYAPAQIVRDALEHGVEVLPIDANASAWDCTLETSPQCASPALRLGLRQIKGFAEADARRLLAARGAGYRDPRALWLRARLTLAVLENLARADSYRSMGLDRRQALWAIKALGASPLPLLSRIEDEAHEPTTQLVAPTKLPAMALLPAMTMGEQIMADYASLRLSLRAHPLTLLRARLDRDGIVPCAHLAAIESGRRTRVAGIVLVRQRPGSANGVIFATLEDETGIANVIVWPDTFERYRAVVLGARLLSVAGRVQREGIVTHVIAETLADLTGHLAELADAGLAGESESANSAFSRAGQVRQTQGQAARPTTSPSGALDAADFPSRDFH